MKFEIIKNKLLSNFSKNKDLKEPVLANTITEHKPTNETEEKAVEIEVPQKNKVEEQKVSQAKKKGGRKSTAHDVKGKVYFVKRDKAIHEPLIADITFSSTDKKLIRELAVRQFVLAYNMTEDYASKILCFIYDNANELDGHNIYFDGLQAISEALELSYPTVQKIVKKLRDKKIISKASIGQNMYYEPSVEANRFFKSISNNVQILLTFEVAEEEQLGAFNEDESFNEEMTD